MGHRQRSMFKKARSPQKQRRVQGTEAGGEEHGRMLRGTGGRAAGRGQGVQGPEFPDGPEKQVGYPTL